MEYVVFIHNNTDTNTKEEQWESFFNAARESGVFNGGSEIANQFQIGNKPVQKITSSIVGIMCFESESKNKILKLLEQHPVIMQGGTLELCEMPKTKK